MMIPLHIPATKETPGVNFDANNQIFEIKGISLPKDANNFYQPIINWLKTYSSSPNLKTIFKIDLLYFNITSSKQILNLFNMLKRVTSSNNELTIEWHYDNDDEMLEMGQDYEYMVGVPFKFVS